MLQGISFAMTEGKTKPPAHFNEATLLSAMENPVAYMESQDKAMARTLGETGGLGTVAVSYTHRARVAAIPTSQSASARHMAAS